MSCVLGVIRYEYVMAIRRWGVWLAFAVAGAGFLSSMSGDTLSHLAYGEASLGALAVAGLAAWTMNTLPPVVGGIAMADRLARDRRLGVEELLRSTSLSRRGYILGKYVGVVLATLTPVLVMSLLHTGLALAVGAPVELIGASLLAFLGINVPAYLFVGAFALACPAIMPVRAFQVLFTGYWIWGNFITPKVMPTLSHTLLTPSGRYVRDAFFGGAATPMGEVRAPIEAVANLVVLAACAAVALLALDRYLAWRAERA